MLGVAIALLGIAVLLIHAAIADKDVMALTRRVLSGG